jgi:hypothetical protein
MRSQPIHRLRRQRHQTARAQNRRRPLQRIPRLGRLKVLRVHSQPQRLHVSIVACETAKGPPSIWRRCGLRAGSRSLGVCRK